MARSCMYVSQHQDVEGLSTEAMKEFLRWSNLTSVISPEQLDKNAIQNVKVESIICTRLIYFCRKVMALSRNVTIRMSNLIIITIIYYSVNLFPARFHYFLQRTNRNYVNQRTILISSTYLACSRNATPLVSRIPIAGFKYLHTYMHSHGYCQRLSYHRCSDLIECDVEIQISQ